MVEISEENLAKLLSEIAHLRAQRNLLQASNSKYLDAYRVATSVLDTIQAGINELRSELVAEVIANYPDVFNPGQVPTLPPTLTQEEILAATAAPTAHSHR